MLNTIIEGLDIPQMLKRGIMTPVLKKIKTGNIQQIIEESL
jgi:hypothetical protein